LYRFDEVATAVTDRGVMAVDRMEIPVQFGDTRPHLGKYCCFVGVLGVV